MGLTFGVLLFLVFVCQLMTSEFFAISSSSTVPERHQHERNAREGRRALAVLFAHSSPVMFYVVLLRFSGTQIDEMPLNVADLI